MPHVEELLDQTDRFYYSTHAATNENCSQQTENNREAAKYDEVEEVEEFNPKDVKIFDTSLFKAGLRFRDNINERITLDKDATKGLASYTEYLRGAKSTPK